MNEAAFEYVADPGFNDPQKWTVGACPIFSRAKARLLAGTSLLRPALASMRPFKIKSEE